jgi:transposase
MKAGLLGGTFRRVIEERGTGRPVFMLDAGLDVGCRGLDVCLLSGAGESIAEFATPADAGGLGGLARRVWGRRVRAVIESMKGARFVHDTLEEAGWEVLVADAQKVKRLAPVA